ncbi:membrane protein insertase YidC [Rhodospirillaceae bacterium SYSU D60014]|uniref:membrane protein insertase YidC n=1 Tax=Virgifigura deserti TaxID=2268457 RepID=UPI000E662986
MDQRNLLLAVLASMVILLGFQYFYEVPRQQQQQAEQAVQQERSEAQPPADTLAPTAPGTVPGTEAGTAPAAAPKSREGALAETPRVRIDTPSLSGSISLIGGRIDDLVLKNYRVGVEPGSENIVLLSPLGGPNAYYADFGWVSAEPGVALPGPATLWQADGEVLTPDNPVTLSWDNGEGLRFSATIHVDRNFVFTVTQAVENTGDAPVTVFPYGLVSRTGTPPVSGFFILHEGLIGALDDALVEVDYDEVQDQDIIRYDSEGGWLGITDKYWLVALMPDQQAQIEARFAHTLRNEKNVYQTDYRAGGLTVAPGQQVESESRLFAGAKEVRLLDAYGEEFGIPLFDRAVDFGWFYFLTKPIFYALDYLYRLVGNFGVAILLLTVGVKLVFFPLANKSYRAMSKMKKLTPEMTKLRDRYKDDKMKLNQEMMALYKREKVNPAAGCLPILIQIPVFFALYKVLFVTIEMRHAPFFGWIQDLSAPDPTSILNLFGLLPWGVPELGFLAILSIGVWPIIMGITMYLQQKLNPAPPDPVQARVFMMLPIVFTFMLGQFPAGLVIYWAWNNLLSIAQQWVIMRRMGVSA